MTHLILFPFPHQPFIEFRHPGRQREPAFREHAVVPAAGHGRCEPGVVGVKQPDRAPFLFDGLVKRAGAAVKSRCIAFFPDLPHDVGCGSRGGIRRPNGILVALPVSLHPRQAVAGKAHGLQGLPAFVKFRIVYQVLCGGSAVKIGRKPKSGAVSNQRGVRIFRLPVRVDQAENPGRQPVVHLVRSLDNRRRRPYWPAG